MDQEGQGQPKQNSFQSKDIGNNATPDFFTNVKGGPKDAAKIEKKRSRITRKTLLIIFSIVAGLVLLTSLIALVIHLVSSANSNIGPRTDEELPTEIYDIELKAYSLVYAENGGGFGDAIVYLEDLVADLEDLNKDENLIFATKCIQAEVAFRAGGEDVAIANALYLEAEASNDQQRYLAYNTLARLYSWGGDQDKAQEYRVLADSVDVEENKVEGVVDEADVYEGDE